MNTQSNEVVVSSLRDSGMIEVYSCSDSMCSSDSSNGSQSSSDEEEEDSSADEIPDDENGSGRTTTSNENSISSQSSQERKFENEAFMNGDRVRIAHIFDFAVNNYAVCLCPFSPEKDPHFAKFGRVFQIFNESGESLQRASFVDNITLRIKIEISNSKESEVFNVKAVDTVNYSLLGDKLGDELFFQTCDKELPWQSLLINDNFLITDQMRFNILNLDLLKQTEVTTVTEVLQEQAHQFYHRIMVDVNSANRKTREMFVESFLRTKHEIDVDE